VGAWGTNIAGRTFVHAVATEELHFNRGRKILVQPHTFWRLRMDHDAVVAKGPLRTTLYLLLNSWIQSFLLAFAAASWTTVASGMSMKSETVATIRNLKSPPEAR